MKRSGRLVTDPVKHREWQLRSRERELANLDSGSVGSQRMTPRQRRNDSRWAKDCLFRYGPWCRACGDTRHIQVDHLIPRAQCGPSILVNGLILGGPFGCGCHDRKTAHQLLVRREWLTRGQVWWLQGEGHVWWTEDGEVWGHHRKLFAPVGES